MKKNYARFSQILVISLITSTSLNAQSTTCAASPVCGTAIAQNFNTSDGGFTSPNFVYFNDPSPTLGDWRIANSTASATYSIVSPAYSKAAGLNNVFAGFAYSGNAGGDITSVTVAITDASSTVILAQCTIGVSGGNSGTFCVSVTDDDLASVTAVRYAFFITLDNNIGGGTQDLIFDDFSNGGQGALVPVALKSFNTKRNSSNVLLQWETSSETNSKGFDIQRKTGNGNFETIAFVATKAIDGTSNTNLKYEYNDMNPSPEASQYRIRMVDNDGQSKFSVIRLIDGLKGVAKTLIYPNPSTQVPVNIIFGNSGARNIQLTDLQGRLHRSWKSYNALDLQLNKLTPGQYLLHITNIKTNGKETHRITITD